MYKLTLSNSYTVKKSVRQTHDKPNRSSSIQLVVASPDIAGGVSVRVSHVVRFKKPAPGAGFFVAENQTKNHTKSYTT